MRRTLFALLALVTLVAGFAAGCASGSGQPHMAAALDHLRAAKGQLDSAMADKGGHRVRAIEIVNNAISEVQAGMEYADSH
ncbi:MAG TPA: hypothetical protein VLV78_09070 [Thermoanaerobaculia bacterium]|nr:hypothetical protein [Thermoanaerobaculia bacterium]